MQVRAQEMKAGPNRVKSPAHAPEAVERQASAHRTASPAVAPREQRSGEMHTRRPA